MYINIHALVYIKCGIEAVCARWTTLLMLSDREFYVLAMLWVCAVVHGGLVMMCVCVCVEVDDAWWSLLLAAASNAAEGWLCGSGLWGASDSVGVVVRWWLGVVVVVFVKLIFVHKNMYQNIALDDGGGDDGDSALAHNVYYSIGAKGVSKRKLYFQYKCD